LLPPFALFNYRVRPLFTIRPELHYAPYDRVVAHICVRNFLPL